MKFKIEQGNKCEGDRVLLCRTNCNDWEIMSFKDILYILDFCFKNEDVLYPPPMYKGRKMLFDLIVKLYNKPILSTVLSKSNGS